MDISVVSTKLICYFVVFLETSQQFFQPIFIHFYFWYIVTIVVRKKKRFTTVTRETDELTEQCCQLNFGNFPNHNLRKCSSQLGFNSTVECRQIQIFQLCPNLRTINFHFITLVYFRSQSYGKFDEKVSGWKHTQDPRVRTWKSESIFFYTHHTNHSFSIWT